MIVAYKMSKWYGKIVNELPTEYENINLLVDEGTIVIIGDDKEYLEEELNIEIEMVKD